jgi:hypothetical protein
MNFRPCFNEPALPLGKIATNELDRVDREDTDLILIIGMDVRPMVIPTLPLMLSCGQCADPDTLLVAVSASRFRGQLS